MPLKNVRYRVTTTGTGQKVRLAVRGGSAAKKTGTVVEAKGPTGTVHTPAEFAADRAKKKPMKAPAMTARMARMQRIKDFEDAHGDDAL